MKLEVDKEKWKKLYNKLLPKPNVDFDKWFNNLDLDDNEDYGLLLLMKEVDRQDVVSEEEFLKSLNSK